MHKGLGNNVEAVVNSTCQKVEDGNIRISKRYKEEGSFKADIER